MRDRAALQDWMRDGCPVAETVPAVPAQRHGPQHDPARSKDSFRVKAWQAAGVVDVTCCRCSKRIRETMTRLGKLADGDASTAVRVICRWMTEHSQTHGGITLHLAQELFGIADWGDTVEPWIEDMMRDGVSERSGWHPEGEARGFMLESDAGAAL